MNKYCLTAAALLLSSACAYAEINNDLIVTATRTAQSVDDTLASVTIITRKDIERLQIRSVQDALQGVPGITIANSGGAGKATSIFLRGTESDHVLVMIDEVKLGSVTTGSTAFQHLPIEQIERIEIVRGPRSSLYGSEAIGGVIQIFTRKGGGDLTPSFSMGTGRYNEYNASAGLSGGGKDGWFSFNASGIDTQGFNACNGKPSPGGAGCYTTELDKDAYRRVSGSLRAGYHFDNGLELDAYVLRSKGNSEYDGSSTNEAESVQQIQGATVRFSPMEIWQLTLAAGRSQDESDNFKDSQFKSRFNTERDSISLQSDFYIANNQLLSLGIDYQNDKVDSTKVYSETSRDDKGVFAQYQINFSTHDLQVSLRQDDNEQFNKHTTGSFAWGYALAKQLRLTAAYGTAFKAPTFNELYYPGYGNSTLEPEESRSVEFGLSGAAGIGSWSLSVYQTDIDQLIAYDSNIYAPANIAQARIRGIEAVYATRFNGWIINSNLSLLNPENRASGSNRGNILARRAQQSLRLDIDRQFVNYSLGASLLAQGRSFNNLGNTKRLDGFATLDLRAEYGLAKNWLLQGRIENLLDKNYQTADFYNQARRGVFVTLRYQP
ncbi:MAG: TonB-dependent vitamin B12 receptor [Cycloclasticus sp.]|nr:TonB-dependent vitamin B12 receptor [Cycloclasticus sp.]